MSKGRHAKDSGTWKKVTLVAGVATTGAIPLSVVSAPPAQAAPISSWDRIAECESNQRWNLPYGDNGRSSGGLQFQPASWNDALAHLRSKGVDTSGFPQGPGHQAYKATKQQQIIAGEALLDLQGPGAWVCNGKTGFPLSSSGPNSSMFNGGVKPYANGGGSTTPAPKPAPSDGMYTVQSGDTLFKIAEAYLGNGEKWKTIYDLNKAVIGSDPDVIEVGQRLKLPLEKYEVKAGDTLYSIAKAHGAGAGADNWKPLYEMNKAVIGPNPNLIQPGQKLTLPGTGGKAAPKPPAAAPSTASFVAPIKANTSRPYGYRTPSYTLGYHTGTDFSAAVGTPVAAVTSGVVVSSDTSSAYGVNVQIKTNDGRYLLYAHLSSRSVSPGQTVTPGQKVGEVGTTGHSSGPHLHFEVRTAPTFGAGNFLNPVSWLASHGVHL